MLLKTAHPSSELESHLAEYVVIDVRELGERVSTIGYLPTSVALPLPEILDDGAVPDVDKNRKILMVCRSGRRSERGGMKLIEAGFMDVTNLAGGTLAWAEAELSIVRLDPHKHKDASPTPVQARDALEACFIDAVQHHEASSGSEVQDAESIKQLLRRAFIETGASFDEPTKTGLTQVVTALAVQVKDKHDLESIARNTAEIMSLVQAIDD